MFDYDYDFLPLLLIFSLMFLLLLYNNFSKESKNCIVVTVDIIECVKTIHDLYICFCYASHRRIYGDYNCSTFIYYITMYSYYTFSISIFSLSLLSAAETHKDPHTN